MALIQQSSSSNSNYKEGVNYTTPFIVITCLFFMWAMITNANDILIPHLKRACNLTDFQSSFVQFFFFGAYFLMSIPASKILSKYGYKKGIIIGLSLMMFGALLFIPSAMTLQYSMFLIALFFLGSGVTLLQVAANPYVSLLGKPETASTRLNLAQGFNSLGAAIAPFLFGSLILSESSLSEDAFKALDEAAQLTYRLSEASTVIYPYIGLAVAVLLLAGLIYFSNLPTIEGEQQDVITEGSGDVISGKTSVWQYSHLTLGVIAIFAYVGAEVAIGSFLIKFAGQENIANLKEIDAKNFPTYYMLGAMIGRFLGSALMTKINPRIAIGFSAGLATLLLLIGMFTEGYIALYAVTAVGLFNSILFPTIFTSAIERLGKFTQQASSYLVMAIVGGAFIPPIMGYVSDLRNIQFAFIVPMLCYAYILFYGFVGSKVKVE
ncbi:MAG: L-fucose:H+ symporter permease [Cytophagales bacterium]|nr:MAG: L-fucose:H+ symporter permease [Cytophagales bacterium]